MTTPLCRNGVWLLFVHMERDWEIVIVITHTKIIFSIKFQRWLEMFGVICQKRSLILSFYQHYRDFQLASAQSQTYSALGCATLSTCWLKIPNSVDKMPELSTLSSCYPKHITQKPTLWDDNAWVVIVHRKYVAKY